MQNWENTIFYVDKKRHGITTNKRRDSTNLRQARCWERQLAAADTEMGFTAGQDTGFKCRSASATHLPLVGRLFAVCLCLRQPERAHCRRLVDGVNNIPKDAVHRLERHPIDEPNIHVRMNLLPAHAVPLLAGYAQKSHHSWSARLVEGCVQEERNCGGGEGSNEKIAQPARAAGTCSHSTEQANSCVQHLAVC